MKTDVAISHELYSRLASISVSSGKSVESCVEEILIAALPEQAKGSDVASDRSDAFNTWWNSFEKVDPAVAKEVQDFIDANCSEVRAEDWE